MSVTSILNGIKGGMATTLGVEFSELPYVNDVEKNNFNSNHNRYGVTAKASFQAETVTKVITMDQTFEMVITKAYIEDGISDDDSRAKNLEIQDLYLDIFKTIYNTKAGDPASVLNVSSLTVAEPEYLIEEKVIVLRASINVLHRFSLI